MLFNVSVVQSKIAFFALSDTLFDTTGQYIVLEDTIIDADTLKITDYII